MSTDNGSTAGTDSPPEGYELVADRIRAFYDRHPDGSITFADPALTGAHYRVLVDPLDEQRHWIEAVAIVRIDEREKGRGTARHAYPADPADEYRRGAEVENVQTAAMGRALAAAGFPGRTAVASHEEIATHRGPDCPDPNRTLAGEDEIRELLAARIPKSPTANRERVSAMAAAGLPYCSVKDALAGMTVAELETLRAHLEAKSPADPADGA